MRATSVPVSRPKSRRILEPGRMSHSCSPLGATSTIVDLRILETLCGDSQEPRISPVPAKSFLVATAVHAMVYPPAPRQEGPRHGPCIAHLSKCPSYTILNPSSRPKLLIPSHNWWFVRPRLRPVSIPNMHVCQGSMWSTIHTSKPWQLGSYKQRLSVE